MSVGKPTEDAQDAEVIDFISTIQKEALDAQIGTWKGGPSLPSTPLKSKKQIFSTPTPSRTPKSSLQPESFHFSPLAKQNMGTVAPGRTLIKTSAHLFYFDAGLASFRQYVDSTIDVELRQTAEYSYFLILWNGLR
jgi:hypothetical protein